MPSKYIKTMGKVLEDFLKRPEPTIPCDKCGKLFRAESEEMVWASSYPQYKNYCYDCYKDAVNENPSEEQIREWAEESIEKCNLSNPSWLCPRDCSYENFKNKVEPMIDTILQERKKKQERDYRKRKLTKLKN